jgi:hypothetical protein
MRESWTPFESGAFAPIHKSGLTYELQPAQRPAWGRASAPFLRFFAYALLPDETVPSVQTTGTVVARMLSERYDPKDEAPYNYNWYWVVKSSDGRLFHSGPHRDVDFGHRLHQPISSLSLGVSNRGS